jgi:hypothetical protein
VELSEEQAAQWGGGKSPLYHNVAGNLFADFDRVWTVQASSIDETSLAQISLVEEKAFRDAAGRTYGRLAIPTHVGTALTRLQKYLKDKGKNPANSPGSMVARIREVRVFIEPDWSEESAKDSVGLTLILDDDEFSVVDDWSPTESTKALEGTLEALCSTRNATQSLTSLSSHLNSSTPGTPEREIIWQKIAGQFERLAATEFTTANPSIGSFKVTISSKSQFNLNDVESSERLDLAHLSTGEV